MNLKLRFTPVSHSWVALHPQPKGVIQFVGGAFFGTFAPMLFYRFLLRSLFEQNYTIILLPFKFSFNHYQEAGFLIREQYEIMPELVRIANSTGCDYEAYLDDTNFSWIGHSLGCKYISLLEGFTALAEDEKERENFIRDLLSGTTNPQKIESVNREIEALIYGLKSKVIEVQQLIQSYVHRDLKIASIFIKGQPSLLLDPDISDTASAIKLQGLADLIDRLGLGVEPRPQETFKLIEMSSLFNLLGLVCFKDKIAKSTCQWFIDILQKPPKDFQLNLVGGHLRPLGIQIENIVINFPDRLPIIESSQKRTSEFESHVIKLFEDIQLLGGANGVPGIGAINKYKKTN